MICFLEVLRLNDERGGKTDAGNHWSEQLDITVNIKREERAEYFDDEGHFIRNTKLLPPVMGQFVKIYSDRMSPGEVAIAAFEELARKMVCYA